MKILFKLYKYHFELSIFEINGANFVKKPLQICFKKEIHDKYSTTFKYFDIINIVNINNKVIRLTIFNKTFTLKDKLK